MSTAAAPGCGLPWRVEADDQRANQEAKERDTVFIDSPASCIQLRRLTQVDLVVNSRGKDGVVVHAITHRRFAIS